MNLLFGLYYRDKKKGTPWIYRNSWGNKENYYR